MTWVEDIIGEVRAFDRARPRSTQPEVGWSEAGMCRAYLGYRIQGEWATDEPDTWAAQRGTAIHTYLLGILDGGQVRTEVPTRYRGIPGHADLVEPSGVTDIKTTRLATARTWQDSPAALKPKRIQAHGYAAGLIDTGEITEPVTVRLLVVPVDGRFSDWWAWEEPFDRGLADEGADRVEYARTLVEAEGVLPKDMPFGWCARWCSFFSLCRGPVAPEAEQITDPGLAAAIAAYGEAGQAISALETTRKQFGDLIRGLDGTAGDWHVSMTRPGEDKPVPDLDAIEADYASRGQTIPMTLKTGSVAKLHVTRVRQAAA